MIFLILFYVDEHAMAALPPDERNQLVERHTAFRQELDRRAHVIDSRGLQPSVTAVTVRPVDGELTTSPGPAVPGGLALAGIYLVECADLAAAVALAGSYPMPEGLGCVEVRPAMATWDYAPTAETAAKPEEVWARYADVARWPEWYHGVAATTLDGPLVAGASGWLTPVVGDPVPVRIVEATPPISFTVEADLAPGATVRTEHCLEVLRSGGTRIVHRATVPRAVLDAFGMEFGPVLYDGMRRSVAALAASLAGSKGEHP